MSQQDRASLFKLNGTAESTSTEVGKGGKRKNRTD
jgi:hypothetical protein